MTSKTHIATSVAVSTALFQPHDFKSLAICIAASTIGGVISDVDVSTSESHKDLVKIASISAFALIACIMVEHFCHIGILTYITYFQNLIIAFVGFLAVCFYGVRKPHRTFMHSILCVFILSVLVDFAIPAATIPFSIGMLSHIAIDLLNKKKVQVFYPLKLKIGLKLCKADGTVNNLIFSVASFIIVIELALFALQYIKF